MEELKSIFLSVLSGVVTAALLYWVTMTINRIVIPAYQRIKYRGVDVSGDWISEYQHSETHTFNFSMTLEQNAHELKGSFNIIKFINGKQVKTTNMTVHGEIWEGFISLKCRTISNRELSFGSALLKVNPTELNGQYIFRNLVKGGNEICSVNLVLYSK